MIRMQQHALHAGVGAAERKLRPGAQRSKVPFSPATTPQQFFTCVIFSLEHQKLSIMRANVLSPFALAAFTFSSNATTQGLNVSAIGFANNASTLECWNLAAPATFARGAANYPMGDSTKNYLGVIPPNTYIGQAWAPYVRVSLFASRRD